ncbi:hypothetical protein PENSPDRAFT_747419 [Peniophora sp. CONT]|nr:hypothetical protein PENSPDRAFT_747419 [Peniophora sp. CONT]
MCPPSPTFSLDSFTDVSSDVKHAPSQAVVNTLAAVVSACQNESHEGDPVNALDSRFSVRPGGLDAQGDSTGDVSIQGSSTVTAVAEDASSDGRCDKSERYFFTADMLTFMVETTAYRVHAYLFSMYSPFWAQRLACEPRSDRICLDNVTKAEMDAFLSTQYPSPTESRNPRTVSEWKAILRLASMWQFEVPRQHAIMALDTRIESPLEKLILARAHDIEDWLHPAFAALCKRPDPLSSDEAQKLSLGDVLAIMTAREALLKANGACLPSEGKVDDFVKQHIHAPRPTTELPRTLLTLSAPPKADELKVLSQHLLAGSYQEVVATIEADNIEAFCHTLADFSSVLRDSTRIDPVLKAILHRGALDPSFIPVGTRLLEALPLILRGLKTCQPGRVLIDEGEFKKLLRIHASTLRGVWRKCAESNAKFGSMELALRHVLSTAYPAYIRQDFEAIMDRCDCLTSSWDKYERLKANLEDFLESLVEAALIPSI